MHAINTLARFILGNSLFIYAIAIDAFLIISMEVKSIKFLMHA